MPHTYEFPRPALTVDCVVFGVSTRGLCVVLIRRGQAPFRNRWALPGGFVGMQETTDDAARRELAEETGICDVYLEQLYTFSSVDRDPRERVVSVAHYALVKPESRALKAGTDATEVEWFSLSEIPELAFDHARILDVALQRLRAKVRYQPIGFELLPEKFTLGQLQRLYESILARNLDKRNFRRAFAKMGILEPLEEKESGVSHRPSQLFRFRRLEYERLSHAGFNFEV